MNEERYAYRVRQALNHGLKDISPTALQRLEAARHLALSKQKLGAATQLAGSGNGSTIALPHHGIHIPHLKQILAVIALLLGMWLSFYWQSVQYTSDLEDIDSALLSDDLPPEAFLDNDFFEWLKDNSSGE